MDYVVDDSVIFDYDTFIKFESQEQYDVFICYIEKKGYRVNKKKLNLCDGLDCVSSDGYDTLDLYHSSNFINEPSYTVYKFEDVFKKKNANKRFGSEQELCDYAKEQGLFISTATQEEYDCLMLLFERCDYIWNDGSLPTEFDGYIVNKTKTCIHFSSYHPERIMFDPIDSCKECRPHATFIKFEEFYEMLI